MSFEHNETSNETLTAHKVDDSANLPSLLPIARNPAIAVRSSGEADVVVQEPDGSLWYYWATPNSPWKSAQIAPGFVYSAPAIAVRSADPFGEADVVAMGPNNSLLYFWATPGSSWSSTQIPGTALSAPAIAVRSANPVGEADVVAMGPAGSLWYYWATPGSSWQSNQLPSEQTG